MKRKTNLIVISMLITLLWLGAHPIHVLAFPPLPSSFWGTVQVNGENVPDGTQITAWIYGMQYGQTQTMLYEGQSVYALVVPGDDLSTAPVEGGTQGAQIEFRVDGVPTDQEGVWQSGTNSELNLTAALSTVTETLPPGSTAIPTQAPITIPTGHTDTGGVAPSGTPQASTVTDTQPGAVRPTPVGTELLATPDNQDLTATSFVDTPVRENNEDQAASDQAQLARRPLWVISVISLILVVGLGATLLILKLRN